MRRWIVNLSLPQKMTLIFGSLVVLLILVPCGILYRYYYAVFQQNVTQSLEIAVNGNADKLQVFLDTVSAAIDQVNDNKKAASLEYSNTRQLSPVGDMIVKYNPPKNDIRLYELVQEMTRNKLFLDNLFTTALNVSGENASYALIVDAKHTVSKYFSRWSFDRDSGIFRSEKADETQWYKRTVEADGEKYWFTEKDYPNRVFLAKCLMYHLMKSVDEYEVKQLGVMLVSFDLSWLAQRFEEAELTKDSLVFVLTEEGKLLYDNQLQETIFTDAALSAVMGIVQEGKLSQYEHDGKQYLIQKNTTEYGIEMLSVIPFHNIHAAILDMIQVIIVVMLIIMIVGVVLATWIGKYLMKPILGLAFHMKQGLLEPIEDYKLRGDEIGILYQGYNQMTLRIQKLIKDAWNHAEEKKKAELHTLQVQMNPHFIYNTLSAVSCNALMQGQDDIADQISSLSAIIRYNIREPEALVPLKDEIEMIGHYEEIWKMSYEDSLQFTHDIAPCCEEILIPKLMIQPLVENAILHGANLAEKVGHVSVQARKLEHGEIVIKVTNNGKDAEVERINLYLQGKCDVEVNKDSFGIRNVYERIQMFFGDAGDLYYQKNGNGETEAVLTIRIEHQKKAWKEEDRA